MLDLLRRVIATGERSILRFHQGDPGWISNGVPCRGEIVAWRDTSVNRAMETLRSRLSITSEFIACVSLFIDSPSIYSFPR